MARRRRPVRLDRHSRSAGDSRGDRYRALRSPHRARPRAVGGWGGAGDLARARGCLPDIDWSQPLTSWPRETMVEFLLKAMRLIRKAMIARDISDRGVTQRSSAGTVAREANAAAGGPLMTPDEFNDEIGL